MTTVVTPPILLNVDASLTPDQARASNAAVPFVQGKIVTLSHFIYDGSAQDRAAAQTCLAAAALYEVGDDKAGEQAVVQVVLNRLRHPAYPKTVCGVVFQGSERASGCQFTFTCDGSLRRAPRPDAWKRASDIADAGLSGFVDASVGTATHYHTDWVVPYWRDTLTKLAQVGTQIFYRWPGEWGKPRAFAGRPQPGERVPELISALLDRPSPAVRTEIVDESERLPIADAGENPEPDLVGLDLSKLGAGRVLATNPDHSQFIILLDPHAYPGSYALAALALCKGPQSCWVMGWTSLKDAPRSLFVSLSAASSMSFLYQKDGASRADFAEWNCRLYPRPVKSQCIPASLR